MDDVQSRFGLALIGIGMRGTDQITIEQLRAFGRSRHIVGAGGLQPSVWRLLATFSATLHDAGQLYVEGADRGTVYQQTADLVVELAEAHGQTSFVQYGHPLVYSRPARMLMVECRRRLIDFKILPGISSIDEMLCVFEIDIRDRDIQILHAEHLFLRQKQFNPALDLVLMQVGLLGESTVLLTPDHRAARNLEPYRDLQAYLLRFYPADHPIRTIMLSTDPSRPHEVLHSTVGRFAELAPRLLHGHTLFIKGLGPGED